MDHKYSAESVLRARIVFALIWDLSFISVSASQDETNKIKIQNQTERETKQDKFVKKLRSV